MRLEITVKKPLFHIVHPWIDGGDSYGGESAELTCIATDTLDGVYANMAKQGWEPGDVKVFYGVTVELETAIFEARRAERYQQFLADQEAVERRQLAALKAKYEGDGDGDGGGEA